MPSACFFCKKTKQYVQALRGRKLAFLKGTKVFPHLKENDKACIECYKLVEVKFYKALDKRRRRQLGSVLGSSIVGDTSDSILTEDNNNSIRSSNASDECDRVVNQTPAHVKVKRLLDDVRQRTLEAVQGSSATESPPLVLYSSQSQSIHEIQPDNESQQESSPPLVEYSSQSQSIHEIQPDNVSSSSDDDRQVCPDEPASSLVHVRPVVRRRRARLPNNTRNLPIHNTMHFGG